MSPHPDAAAEAMSEIIHAWAVAPAAVGACCLAADRARVRPPEVAASVLVPLAMLDAALFRVVAPVWWTALLLVAAVALAVWRRPRQRRTPRTPALMTLHTTLGMVVMAELQLGMGGRRGTLPRRRRAPMLATAALSYVGLSVLAMRHITAQLDGAQIAAFAASVVLMGGASA